jgi:glycosyltransferase involved in cell wall biosynthesis
VRRPRPRDVPTVAAALRRWIGVSATRPVRGRPAVSYGFDRLPARSEHAEGGIVKFRRLAERLPAEPCRFNVLYLGSSRLPPDWRQLVWLARRRGAALVWNQDGVAYPAWHGPGWERANAPIRRALARADHVFYQSEFCKLSSDRFAGPPGGTWELLYNAVDTSEFVPDSGVRRDRSRPVLLLGGSQYERYRIESALAALAALVEGGVDARLRVTGAITFLPDPREAAALVLRRIAELGLEGRVELVGPYTQAEAPALLASSDVLVHTKYNDPCPGIVIEAMACGLPVAYSASGGVPELVGEHAGVGVRVPLGWETLHAPDPDDLAGAVMAILDRREDYAAAARARAVERFDLVPWVERHRQVFARLASR